jgi:transketolase
VLSLWREAGKKAGAARAEWQKRLDAHADKPAFETAIAGDLPSGLGDAIAKHRAALIADAPKVATRKASELALEVINAQTDLTVGGSADLTGSNNTLTKSMDVIEPGNFGGRYVHFGVREHGMAACLNGLALHGGFIPYSGTFLVFTDYARAAMRLSALMGLRVIYVMTHDSIGLGEDGPTHQPVEHVASLRAMPNMRVFRPCDAVETAECWEVALGLKTTPSTIALSRQGLSTVRTEDTGENLSAKGAYVLRDTDGSRDVTLLATGSEVEIAVAASEKLAGEGVKAAVVSMPSWDDFDAQDDAYRASVLGDAPRIAIEAGVEMGWSKYTGNPDAFIGMSSFGASAPAGELFEHFGITADALVAKAKGMLGKA